MVALAKHKETTFLSDNLRKVVSFYAFSIAAKAFFGTSACETSS